MIFPKDLLDLQLTFAEHVSASLRIPLEQALLDYTNLYVRFGLGRGFDAQHPVWLAYLAGLRTVANVRQYTHEFYLRVADAPTAPPTVERFGCFSWAREGSEAIRLHFLNDEAGDVSPLSHAQREARQEELAAVFAHAKAIVGNAPKVVGISWLYNLEAYRRLFPPAYGDSRQVVRARFRGMSLWGQFLDHRGRLKQSAARRLLNGLAQQPIAGELDRCFPFQVMTTEAPIQQFYAFYGV